MTNKTNKYKWDLTKFYSSELEYNKDLKKLETFLKKIIAFENTLKIKKNFLKFLELEEVLDKLILKLNIFNTRLSLDSANQEWQMANEKLNILLVEYSPKLSWIESEIKKTGKQKILEFISAEKKHSHKKFYFERFFQLENHIISRHILKTLLLTQNSRTSASNIHEMFRHADYKNPTLIFNNKKVILTQKKMTNILEMTHPKKDQHFRKLAAFEYQKKYYDFKYSFFEMYKSILSVLRENTIFEKYKSPLQKKLKTNNLHEDIFFKMLNEGPNFKKYSIMFENIYKQILRKKYDLKKINSSDKSLNIFKISKKFTIEEAKELILIVSKQVSNDYYKAVKQSLEIGKIDYLESEKKDKGAFCTATSFYDPLILLNFTNDIDSVLTLAHEVGHSVHSIYSNNHQQFIYQNYPIFLAEIASITFELLVLNHLLNKAKKNKEKLYLLFKKFNLLEATFSRQLQYSEFEHTCINQVFNQEAITCENFADHWENSLKKYFEINTKTKSEFYKKYLWSRVPHFFDSPYYVWQYASSMVASVNYVNSITNNKSGDFENLLKLGSSKYPNEILKDTNINLLEDKPYNILFSEVEKILFQIKKLL